MFLVSSSSPVADRREHRRFRYLTATHSHYVRDTSTPALTRTHTTSVSTPWNNTYSFVSHCQWSLVGRSFH
ncbi:hypothetical protein QTP88_017802 [Uroleucon formosanum]